jgi:membrane-associated phospholipid phosphatase
LLKNLSQNLTAKTPSPPRKTVLPITDKKIFFSKNILTTISKLLFMALFLVIGQPAPAETPWISPDPDTSIVHFPCKLADDVPRLFISENIIPFSVGGLATAVQWAAWDGKSTLASDLQNWNVQPMFDLGNIYGEGWVQAGGALGSWAAGAIAGDARLQQFGRDAAESLLVSTVLVTAIKLPVDRTRPNGGDHSFPSGHTITAFCIAPVVTRYFGWGAGVPAYLLATVTGLARVEGNYHYLSDVFAGATLGIVIGNAVVYQPKDLEVSLGPGRLGLKWRFN